MTDKHWLPLVRPEETRYGDGSVTIRVFYIIGLADGAGRKLHIGPSVWADDSLMDVAFCRRDLFQPEPWTTPSDWQLDAWVRAMQGDVCAICLKVWLALEDEVRAAQKRESHA